MRPERYDQRHMRDLTDQARAAEAQADGATSRGLPPSKRYKVDPTYCRTPWAVCGNTAIGLPTCEKGEGKFCYCRIPCSSQMEEDGQTRIKAAQKLYEEESDAALKHAREVAASDPSYEEHIDSEVDEIMRWIAL